MKYATRNYNRALAAMEKLTGFDCNQILRAEAGIILKTCASRTKVTKTENLRDGARVRSLRGLGLTRGKVTINAGIKATYGRVWMETEPAKKGIFGLGASRAKYQLIYGDNFSKNPRHITSKDFREVSQKMRQAKTVIAKGVREARKTAALARNSWIQIADRLGIRLESVQGGGSISASAIAKARGAEAKNQAQTRNGRGRMDQTVGRTIITLINRLPYGKDIGLDSMLKTVMAGRAIYFSRLVKKGFDGSLQAVTKSLPGWTVKL